MGFSKVGFTLEGKKERPSTLSDANGTDFNYGLLREDNINDHKTI